jgi:hypothetical protein
VVALVGGFDHPAVDAQAAAVSGTASGDARGDPQCADPVAVSVVVVAEVGVEPLRAPACSPALASDRRYCLEQRDQLGHVVAVATGQCGGRRDAVGLDDEVVLLPALPRSAGDRPVFAPSFIARTCEPYCPT